MIVGAQTLTLRETLKRDPKGLSNNKAEMKGVKNLVIFLLIVVVIVAALAIVASGAEPLFIVIPAYGCLMLYHFLELLVGTMYLQRVGWIFLKDSDWEFSLNGQQSELGNEDSHLRKLTSWGTHMLLVLITSSDLPSCAGDRQLVPKWEPPHHQRRDEDSVTTVTGRLVDLSTGVCVDAVVTEPPDFVLPLAIHGTGVSCLLLKRPKDAAKHPVYWAKKVGMANFPTYILAQTDKESDRTIVVGSDSKATEEPAAVNGPPTGGDV
jgi:hypothetical protein